MKINRAPQTPKERFLSNFNLPKRPGEEVPELPRSLDDLPDESLMDLFSEFTAWMNYAKAALVEAEIEESAAENALKVSESKALITQWAADAKGDRVTLAKARRDIEPFVVSDRDSHLNARAYRKLVEAMYDRCDRCCQLLSRELSRRISMSPKDRMSSRYSA